MWWINLAKELIKRVNTVVAGWAEYFRVGNSSRAFSEVRDYLEMKVRTLLTRRKRRQKRSVGWRRWSNEYLYVVLGLFWIGKSDPCKCGGLFVKAAAGTTRTHNLFGEAHRASCLRENLTNSSYGEGLETGREFAQEPRQSFTRQIFSNGSNSTFASKHSTELPRTPSKLRSGSPSRFTSW